MNTFRFLLCLLGLIFFLNNSAISQTPECESGILTFMGPLFESNAEPILPNVCTDFMWQVNTTALGQEFAHIQFDFDNVSNCLGSTILSIEDVGNNAGSFTVDNNSFTATIFIRPSPNAQPQPFCEITVEFEILDCENIPIQGTSDHPHLIGVQQAFFAVNDFDEDFFNLPLSASDITWTFENISTGGSYTFDSFPVNTVDNVYSTLVNLDECSDGHIVASVANLCGSITEYARFRVNRICPELLFTGPSSCNAVWCGDANETFSYIVDKSSLFSGNTTLGVRFSSQLNVVSTSQNASISNNGGMTELSATEAFSFEIQPSFPFNTSYDITAFFSACENTENSCNETKTLSIYSGIINAIDLDLNVYGTGPGSTITIPSIENQSPFYSKQLCLYRNNYVEASYRGEGDPCVLEWDWMVPAGWQIAFPNYPDKSVALIIPNSTYGDVFVRARNECGWSNWISHGFSVTSNCRGRYKTNESLTENRIFPNPIKNDEMLAIETNVSDDIQVLKIYNSLGKIEIQENLVAYKELHQIKIADLPIGIYWLSIDNNKSYKIQKLIVTD